MKNFLLILLTTSLSLSASAQTKRQYAEDWIRDFFNNPKSQIDKIPPKFDSQGRLIPSQQIPLLSEYLKKKLRDEKPQLSGEELKAEFEAIDPAKVKTWLDELERSKAHVEAADQIRAGDPENNIEGIKLVDKDGNPTGLPEARARIERNDKAEQLVDVATIRSKIAREHLTDGIVKGIDYIAENLTSATLENSPWSDSYWPTYQGHLGSRYADSRFINNAHDFKASARSWFGSRSAFDNIMRQFNSDAVNTTERAFYRFVESYEGDWELALNNLSPAEKYDLLVGDASFTMTRKNWENAFYTQSRFGEVETWTGLCHGWAPAAYMMNRPTAAVRVSIPQSGAVEAIAAEQGIDPKKITEITFYPSDIKAYGTSLWADASPGSRFIGSRCNDKNVKTDSETGRITDQGCFDNNPASFLLALVNQVGIAKRSLVLDATYDFEVWNHPVYSYKLNFWNVQTGSYVNSLAAARVPYGEFQAKDKFAKIRTKRYEDLREEIPKEIVGVALEVTYVVETDPYHQDNDSARDDAYNTALYLLDVEVNAQGNLTGGEWYQNKHPDFLWTPAPGARATIAVDRILDRSQSEWSADKALPSRWQEAIQRSSTRTPSAKIVESLTEFANNQ